MALQHWMSALLGAAIAYLHMRFWEIVAAPFKGLLGKLEEDLVEDVAKEVAERELSSVWKRVRKWMSRNCHPKSKPPERKPMSPSSCNAVKFTLVDAKKPVKFNNLIALSAPLDLTLNNEKEFILDLGFKCDQSLLVLPSSKLDIVGSGFVLAGTPAKIAVRARIDGIVSRGERILYAYPLISVDYVIG